MLKPRMIPCLLLKGNGLVKTVQFKDPTYVGDPINTFRIFNTKEVDEIILLNIAATRRQESFPLNLLSRIFEECFMPLTYGGGIKNLDDMKRIFNTGVEKVAVNSAVAGNFSLIQEAAQAFGSQSIIVSMDVRQEKDRSYGIYSEGGTKLISNDPVGFARAMEAQGAGEILLNSIDRDGTMQGYDVDLIQSISDSVNIPVIACGGAGSLDDFGKAVYQGHASAVAAGSLFVFHGRRRAVLISFPTRQERETLFKEEIDYHAHRC